MGKIYVFVELLRVPGTYPFSYTIYNPLLKRCDFSGHAV